MMLERRGEREKLIVARRERRRGDAPILAARSRQRQKSCNHHPLHASPRCGPYQIANHHAQQVVNSSCRVPPSPMVNSFAGVATR